LAAALVVLEKLKGGDIQKHLNQFAKRLAKEVNDIALSYNMKVRAQGFGGQFQIYFTPQEITDWRTAYRVDKGMYMEFQDHIIKKGILWSTNCHYHHGITAAHTEEDLKTVIQACKGILERMGNKYKQC
jgi:glutamate-1-semialdehyde 2,1-aminomutase